MAPLARTLALLAMAVATVAIKVVPLDMAWGSFDDQYLQCHERISEDLLLVMVPDFCNNSEFFENWKKATDQWKKQGSVSSPLTKDQAIAVMAYTMNETTLYKQFNDAVREAGSSRWKYWKKFHFKSLHFLLTQAVQKLRRPYQCQDVFRGVKNYQYKVEKDDEVRFGQFASTSRSKAVAQGFGQDTMFKVRTCHGADIQKFSRYPSQREVLIPPFETFKVIDVRTEDNTMHIELHSKKTLSNYSCEWLTGGSLPKNSPHLEWLLLATVAMAMATRTL